MNKLIGIIVLALCISSCQETQKIAFVDNVKVFEEYQEKIDVEASIKSAEEAFKRKTDSIGRAYQIEAAPLQAKASKMSPQQQQSNPEILAFSQKWQGIEEQIKAEETSMQEQFKNDLEQLDTNVEEFIASYAKKNNIAFVFGKNKTGNVMYGNDAGDITEVVIKELNDSYNKGNNTASTTDTDETKSTDEEETKE